MSRRYNALLVGNGLELNFQKNLSKEMMTKNILEGDTNWPVNDKKPSIFPYAIKEFWKGIPEAGAFPLNDAYDLPMLEKILRGDLNNKSIEDIYIEICNAIDPNPNGQKRDAIKKLFVEYIRKYDSDIHKMNINTTREAIGRDGKPCDESQNIVKNKLKHYDIILTTNYTDLIEWIYPELEGKVIHIHGTLDNPIIGDKHDPKLIKEALDNLEKVHTYFKEDEYINYSGVDLDVYGWSFVNDDYLLGNVVRALLGGIYQNKINSEQWVQWTTADFSGTKIDEILSGYVHINYYFYNDKDIETCRNSESYIKSGDDEYLSFEVVRGTEPQNQVQQMLGQKNTYVIIFRNDLNSDWEKDFDQAYIDETWLQCELSFHSSINFFVDSNEEKVIWDPFDSEFISYTDAVFEQINNQKMIEEAKAGDLLMKKHVEKKIFLDDCIDKLK